MGQCIFISYQQGRGDNLSSKVKAQHKCELFMNYFWWISLLHWFWVLVNVGSVGIGDIAILTQHSHVLTFNIYLVKSCLLPKLDSTLFECSTYSVYHWNLSAPWGPYLYSYRTTRNGWRISVDFRRHERGEYKHESHRAKGQIHKSRPLTFQTFTSYLLLDTYRCQSFFTNTKYFLFDFDHYKINAIFTGKNWNSSIGENLTYLQRK